MKTTSDIITSEHIFPNADLRYKVECCQLKIDCHNTLSQAKSGYHGYSPGFIYQADATLGSHSKGFQN